MAGGYRLRGTRGRAALASDHRGFVLGPALHFLLRALSLLGLAGALFQTAPLFAVYRGLGASYGLPLLLQRSGEGGRDDALVDRVLGIEPGVTTRGWLAAYQKLLSPLPPGAYELIVHLAYDDEEMRGATSDHPDWGAQWRQNDLDLVRAAQFRDFLKANGFTLVGWKDLARPR